MSVASGNPLTQQLNPHTQHLALPLHIQRLQRVLDVCPYLQQLEDILKENETKPLTQNDTKTSKEAQFNFANVTPEREWIKDLLLSDTEGSDNELTDSDKIKIMLELNYRKRQKWKNKLKRLSNIRQYQYISAGLLLQKDKYTEIKKSVALEKKKSKKSLEAKRFREETCNEVKKDERMYEDDFMQVFEREPSQDPDEYRSKLWNFIVKKEIPKMSKAFSQARHVNISNNKKIAVYCQREVRRWATKSQKLSKEANSVQPRARKVLKEVIVYWRKYEKVEKEARKKAEKEAQEQQKLYDEMREARRQQRKLNFLITQTELYAHFMSKKFTGEEKSTEDILKNLDDKPFSDVNVPQSVMNRFIEDDEYDCDAVKAKAINNVQIAVDKHKVQQSSFIDVVKSNSNAVDLQQSFDQNFSLANPALTSDREIPQPLIFNGKLKAYQLKGMNWLASLYDQGINGILADEMGLGKTVQSIALLGHLAEHQDIWGPFLIISPASTLHNWQQECARFIGVFKVLPYWGSPHERKVIRKYWNQKLLCNRNAPFHVLITSYQLVVLDFKYFQRVKWQYMILDEAQALKSSSSARWKMLMSFNCRSRLLLTGTPIQNTMAELWALLHFIMPTMFDSHEEFSEWFSKDIESHAERKSALDENQLSRLHMILKPFMLRRIKKDVEHEMAEKIEIHLSCGLSGRQKELYHRLKERISIDDLLHSSVSQHQSKDSTSGTSTLMNIVMQFRKVCNHPDLFEHSDVKSPISLSLPLYSLPRLVYHQCLLPFTARQRLLMTTLGVSSTDHIHSSTCDGGHGLWNFSKLCNLSPTEGFITFSSNFHQRFNCLIKYMKYFQIIFLQRLWDSELTKSKRYLLLLHPSFPFSYYSLSDSTVLSKIIFTSYTSSCHSFSTHVISPFSKLQKNPLNEISFMVATSSSSTSVPSVSSSISSQLSSNKNCTSTSKTSTQYLHNSTRHYLLTSLPNFLINNVKLKVSAGYPQMYVADRHAEYHRQESAMSPEVKSLFLHGLPSNEAVDLSLSPRLLGGLEGSHPSKGWSYIDIPDKERLITDSHKMVVLDRLLTRLKLEGHRVLIYSQMTKMIDLLEEFMTHRRHKYIRLDGSSRISERRDMVNDFQTKSEIFVFLLSTRAGGLGINLTAADTVIFYDSDWNPTVDQQAMDRAHRLGQTKQVTVYRLIVKGSIEERILQRAHEKSEIQKMVISGGDFKIDTLKPKEVVSLILDDEEMETRFLAKQAEKKAQEESIKQRNATNRKRKNTTKKPAEGSPLVKKAQPAAACSISPSPTPSRPPSVTSFTTNDTVNGEYIDVVGGVETELVTRPPINNNTPPRATNKRSRRGGTKGNNSSKRIKLMNQMTPSHQLVHNNGTGHAPH